MANNPGYHGNNVQQPQYANTLNTDTSYDRERDLPRLPSYNSESDMGNGHAQPSYPQQTKSPFTAPFDDHVYPAPASPYRSPSNDPSINPSLGENTAYYGQGGGGRPQDSQQFSDNIPLRDHNKTMASNDHVYDIENSNPKRKGIGFGSGRFRFGNGQKTAWVVWLFTIIQVAVFIAELVKSAQLTGSPIQTSPFNPMIGPSPYVLINMGSRYTPCMRSVKEVTDMTAQSKALDWFCPSTRDLSVADSALAKCRLMEICAFGAEKKIDKTLSGQVKNETVVPTQEQVAELNQHPDQWFRFIVPMFLHAGIIHLLFNMLLQLTLGRDMEKEIGSIRFFIVYVCAGIFGFVMGGNFAGVAVSSVGASGALFGVIALTLLDLLYTWSERPSPVKDLLYIILDIAISFVLGLLPGLDNFAHIGGFLMGLVLGICILHSPSSLRKRIGAYEPPYQGLATSGGLADEQKSGALRFVKSPMGFFKGRKGGWWAWWLIRAAALVAVLVVFVVLVQNFYRPVMHVCGWCRYLSCLVS